MRKVFKGRTESFKEKAFHSSVARMLLVIALPLLAAAALTQQALHYFDEIPIGDGSFRTVVVGVCALLAAGLGFVSMSIFHSFNGQTIRIESGRLVVRDSHALVSSDWGDVTISETRSRLGVRQIVVGVAGRPRVVDDFFFPNFDEIRDSLQERVRTFDRAVRRSLVASDWVQAG